MQLRETVPSREFGWHLRHVESSVVLWSKWICSLIKGGFVCFLNLLWIRTDSHSRHFCTIRSWRKSYIGTTEPCNRCNSICYNSNSYWLLLHVLQLNKYNLNNYGVNWIFIWDTLSKDILKKNCPLPKKGVGGLPMPKFVGTVSPSPYQLVVFDLPAHNVANILLGPIALFSLLDEPMHYGFSCHFQGNRTIFFFKIILWL